MIPDQRHRRLEVEQTEPRGYLVQLLYVINEKTKEKERGDEFSEIIQIICDGEQDPRLQISSWVLFPYSMKPPLKK